MKNVLLLCLSPVNKAAGRSIYSFTHDNGDIELIDGYQTNEAPAKSVIKRLASGKKRGKLDQVIMISSDEMNRVIVLNDDSELNEVDLGLSDPIKYLRHKDYYVQVVNQFAESVDPSYKEHPIQYEEVSMPDFASGDIVLTKTVIEAATKILSEDENVNLYVDYNGGPRTVAFLIVALSNLMKLRNVSIRQIMSMNYDNKVDGVVPIQNLSVVFSTFDLITGINEYINYGRIKGLKEFFKNAKDDDIHTILDEMEKFSQNLQLCRTKYILEKRSTLSNMLNNYVHKSAANQNDTYEQLFRYVVNDIIDGYKGMIDGKIPDVINWCVDRAFIQQALTFAAEELPGFFWHEGIYRASEEEVALFNSFLSKTKQKFASKGRSNPETYGKYPYEWMITFAPNSIKIKADDEGKGKKEHIILTELSSFGLARKKHIDRNYALRLLQKTTNSVKNATNIKSNIINAARKPSQLLLSLTQLSIAESCCSITELSRILLLYFIIKNQRNKANHADDTRQANLLNYNEIEACLKMLIDNINNVEKAQASKCEIRDF